MNEKKCFYCGEDWEIVLSRRGMLEGSEGERKFKENFDGKIISKDPCNKCQEYMKMGIILISIRDGDGLDETPYRTGGFWVLKEEAIKRLLNKDFAELLAKVLKSRAMWIEDSTCRAIGLEKAQ